MMMGVYERILLSTLGRLVGFTGLGFFLFYTLAGSIRCTR